MQIDLKPTGFPFFKVVVSFVFLISSIFLPLISAVTIFIIFFARVHALGAFFAMWRAKRLTWQYLICVMLMIVGVSYLGVNVLSIYVLSFIAFVTVSFHFIYDEYELQEENRTFENIVLMVGPLLILFLVIFRDFFQIPMSFLFFLAVAGFTFLIEAIYVRKINWIFVSSKVQMLFFLLAIYIGKDITYIIYTLLMLHYVFWLAYPVYKLNKYVKDDRDDFIMMMLLLIFFAAFVYSTSIWGVEGMSKDVSTRIFYIASIVHIFSTAPFAYFFGLKRKSYELKK